MNSPYPRPQTYATPNLGEPPLWAPFYGANGVQAIQRFFKKYATFTGRASRSEYWWWAFVQLLFIGALWAVGLADNGHGGLIQTILMLVWFLGTAVPNIALTVRRLHDANFSGAFILLSFVPLVGGLVMLVFMLLPANPAGQRFDSVS